MSMRRHCWTKDNLSIEIIENKLQVFENLDVVFRIPNHKVSLLISGGSFIKIQDVQGNGYYSGLQGKGIGTLLFNTALQVLKYKYSEDIEVMGQMSPVDDPKEPNLAEECRQRRACFWETFGFEIVTGKQHGWEWIKAKLKELNPKMSGLVLNKYSRFVNINEFKIKND